MKKTMISLMAILTIATTNPSIAKNGGNELKLNKETNQLVSKSSENSSELLRAKCRTFTVEVCVGVGFTVCISTSVTVCCSGRRCHLESVAPGPIGEVINETYLVENFGQIRAHFAKIYGADVEIEKPIIVFNKDEILIEDGSFRMMLQKGRYAVSSDNTIDVILRKEKVN